MATPPVMLLDVNGVLNAHGPYADTHKRGQRRYNPRWGCTMSTGMARTRGENYTFWWAQPMVDRLCDLHDSGLVEIRWASTWNSDIDAVETLFKMPSLPRAFSTTGVHHRDIPRLKRQAAARVLDEENRRLIWADDQEVPFTWELSHAAMTLGGRALLIRPREALGLLPTDLDNIDQYLEVVAGVDTAAGA